MNLFRRLWNRLVIILTTPITSELLFRWWRRKPKAAAEIILEEPKAVSLEPLFFIPPLDTKKFSPGPRFVIERRRRAMKAGKIAGPTG